MNKEKISNYSKMVVIFIGAICLTAAILTLPSNAYSVEYFLILGFGILVAPRTSIQLPRSKFAISFADAAVILTFLLFGGSAAILLASVEMLASCLYLRSQGFKFGPLMVPVNVSISLINTSTTYLIWLAFPVATGIQLDPNITRHLIYTLGILAFLQFLTSSFLAAVFQSIKDSISLWTTWKEGCFSSSMTQIVGAGVAGLVYKLINFGDPVTAAIAFVAIVAAYLNYRQAINEINGAIANVEIAEKQKSETERERRQEAERYAQELSLTLDKEARANEALRKSEKDFQYAALHDSLTGLANRKHLGDFLRNLIDQYKEDQSVNFQVLFLDIRSFKNINDTLGHTIGDKVLSIAAKRFLRIVNPDDTVARIGGDEFAIILRGLSTPSKALKVARKIQNSITHPFSLSGNKISIDVNIGIAPCDAEYETPEEILRDADIAMHFAKEKNDGPAVFTKEMRNRFLERVRFEMDLQQAIERNELSMHYQPIVSLSDGRLIGFEALLRWQHSEFGMIPPNKFIPIAESSDLIQPITLWILKETTRHLAEWQKIGPEYKELMISVNISGKHLTNDDLIDDVEIALDASGIAPHTLKLEMTESTAMENPEHTISVLRRLKQIGIQLSIDDFGTGYSSLSHLHRLPFDTLKIDRSFVFAVGEHGENSGILQTIISLAKNLQMRVVAEGIETEAQLSILQGLHCDYGQGYLLAKPKSLDETEKLLYEHPNWLPFGVTDIAAHSSESSVSDENLPVF